MHRDYRLKSFWIYVAIIMSFLVWAKVFSACLTVLLPLGTGQLTTNSLNVFAHLMYRPNFASLLVYIVVLFVSVWLPSYFATSLDGVRYPAKALSCIVSVVEILMFITVAGMFFAANYQFNKALDGPLANSYLTSRVVKCTNYEIHPATDFDPLTVKVPGREAMSFESGDITYKSGDKNCVAFTEYNCKKNTPRWIKEGSLKLNSDPNKIIIYQKSN